MMYSSILWVLRTPGVSDQSCGRSGNEVEAQQVAVCSARSGISGICHHPKRRKTNPKLLDDVKQLPIPQDVCGVRQFLGTASYYRWLTSQFANLHSLYTSWWAKTYHVNGHPIVRRLLRLKDQADRGTSAGLPSLWPKFCSGDRCLWPRPGSSPVPMPRWEATSSGLWLMCALSRPEKNYRITELETLWKGSHRVYTDHSVVKAPGGT